MSSELLRASGLHKSFQTGDRQNNRMKLTFIDAFQPGFDVAAQGLNIEIRAQVEKLALTPQT